VFFTIVLNSPIVHKNQTYQPIISPAGRRERACEFRQNLGHTALSLRAKRVIDKLQPITSKLNTLQSIRNPMEYYALAKVPIIVYMPLAALTRVKPASGLAVGRPLV